MTDPRKILYLDIETKPAKVWTWDFWNVNISPDKIIEPNGLLCFAASWDSEKKIRFHSENVDGFEAMVHEAWKLLNEADVVVTYNGNKFDIPHLQRAFTLVGLPSPSPFVSVDLFAVMKKEQRGVWPSLRLAYLSQQLELSGKLPNDGFQLWLDCIAGDLKAWRQMERYNKQDVKVLKDAFPLLRHKVKNLPSASLYMDTDERVCPNCGSQDFQSRGVQRNKTRSYRRFFCNACQSWFRGNTSISAAEVVSV